MLAMPASGKAVLVLGAALLSLGLAQAEVCAPLATAVVLAAEGKDPKPTICANLEAMTCITGPVHQNVCGGLPKKANDLGAAVPLTTEGLHAMCGVASPAVLHLDTPGQLLGSELAQALNETSVTTTVPSAPVSTTVPSAPVSAAVGMDSWGAVSLLSLVVAGISTA